MSGIVHKIGEALHVGGDHKKEEHKKEGEGHHKEEGHKKEGEGHKEGIIDKIKDKIHGGEQSGEHGEKKKKEKKKKEKKQGEGHHGDGSSSSSDSD